MGFLTNIKEKFTALKNKYMKVTQEKKSLQDFTDL